MKLEKRFLENLFTWKNGLLVDIFLIGFFLVLNLVYLFSFFTEADKSNIFSAPLIPLVANLVSLLTGLTMARSVTIALLIFLVLSPASLYFFTIKLTGRRLSGFSAGLLYSLPAEWFAKGKIKMTFLIGDGGHIAALTFVPIIALFLLNFLRSGSFKNLIFASLGLGLAALTSPFGFLISIMAITITAFSEFLQGEGKLKIFRFLIFLGVTVGFIAFWYNPGFISLFLKSSQGTSLGKTFFNLIPLSFVILPIVGAFGFLLFEKKTHLQPLFIALGLVVLFSLLSFADYTSQLFPTHPRRYLPVLGFSIAFLFGILATAFSDYLRFKGRFHKAKLTPLGRSLARKAFWLSSTGIMGAMILFSLSSLWQLPETQVLGLWNEGVVLGGAWEVRRQTGRASAVIGYLVTTLTVFLTVFAWSKIKKSEKSN